MQKIQRVILLAEYDLDKISPDWRKSDSLDKLHTDSLAQRNAIHWIMDWIFGAEYRRRVNVWKSDRLKAKVIRMKKTKSYLQRAFDVNICLHCFIYHLYRLKIVKSIKI